MVFPLFELMDSWECPFFPTSHPYAPCWMHTCFLFFGGSSMDLSDSPLDRVKHVFILPAASLTSILMDFCHLLHHPGRLMSRPSACVLSVPRFFHFFLFGTVFTSFDPPAGPGVFLPSPLEISLLGADSVVSKMLCRISFFTSRFTFLSPSFPPSFLLFSRRSLFLETGFGLFPRCASGAHFYCFPSLTHDLLSGVICQDVPL